MTVSKRHIRKTLNIALPIMLRVAGALAKKK